MPELVVGQAGKELTHNQALAVLDQLAQAVVVDKDLTAPPGSPANGSMYIVAAGAIGAWAGQSGKLAYWLTTVAAWTFITPADGWSVWVTDEGKRYELVSGVWTIVSSGGGGSGDMLSTLLSAEISITGTATLTGSAFGKMHVSTGTTADYTITLPAATGNAGKLIGFRMAPALTKIVTVDANASELIDGATTRVMWANEVAVLLCDGTSWTKIAGKSIPIAATATRVSAQSIASGVVTTIDLDTAAYDPASIIDLGTDRITIKRPGTYSVVFKSVGPASGSGASRQAYLFVNGASLDSCAPDYGQRICYRFQPFTFATGDYLQLSVSQSNGVAEDFQYSVLSVIESTAW